MLCVLPEGHKTAHDDLLGTSWTDETHYDQSEVERLRETVARVEAIHSPVEVEPSETICAGCSTKRGSGASLRYFPYVDWPCETVAALAEPTGQETE